MGDLAAAIIENKMHAILCVFFLQSSPFHPVNCVCQPGGIAVPGDLFSGAPSPELGRTSGTQLTGEGKTIWTGLCSVAEL